MKSATASRRSGQVCYPVSNPEPNVSVSDEMYRRIVEAVPEGIWVVDPQGRTIFSNLRMAEILGTDFESMSEQSCFACVFPDELADAQRHFGRTLAGDRRPFDFRLRRADGSPIWVSISCMAMCDDTGAPVGLLGLFSDITERKRTEADLRESEERFRNVADTAPVAGVFQSESLERETRTADLKDDGMRQESSARWVRIRARRFVFYGAGRGRVRRNAGTRHGAYRGAARGPAGHSRPGCG